MGRMQFIVFTAVATVFVATHFIAETDAATVGYWRFESDLLDASGQGNDASHQSATPVFSSGVFGTPVPRTGAANTSSLNFNNTTGGATASIDFLDVSHDPSLNIATGSFTIEAWVRLDVGGASPVRQYIVQKKDATTSDPFSSYTFMARAGDLIIDLAEQNVMALAFGDGTNTNYIFSTLGTNDISDTGWHHMSVGVDRDNGNVRFTLDGVVDPNPNLVGILNGPNAGLYAGINNTDSVIVGAHSTTARPPTNANHGFDGGIDELRISNVFLPASQLLPVPEPASVTLAIAGVILLVSFMALAARRRSNLRRLHDANQANSS